MKIKLWDYSKEWGNLQGIICPKFSLFWTMMGAAFLFLLYPPLSAAVARIGTQPYLSLPIGVIYGIMLVDFGLSVNLSAKIRAAAAKAREVVSYERFKAFIAADARKEKRRRSFLFPFRSKRTLKENLERFLASVRAKISDGSADSAENPGSTDGDDSDDNSGRTPPNCEDR